MRRMRRGKQDDSREGGMRRRCSEGAKGRLSRRKNVGGDMRRKSEQGGRRKRR